MKQAEGKEELVKVFRAYAEAVNTKDIETCYKYESDSFGYGYRSPEYREVRNKSDYVKAMENFYASMKDYEFRINNQHVKTFNDVGFVSGEYTERIVEKDDTVRHVNGRGTSTWMKIDGNWKLLLYHRDTQFNNP